QRGDAVLADLERAQDADEHRPVLAALLSGDGRGDGVALRGALGHAAEPPAFAIEAEPALVDVVEAADARDGIAGEIERQIGADDETVGGGIAGNAAEIFRYLIARDDAGERDGLAVVLDGLEQEARGKRIDDGEATILGRRVRR